MAASVPTDKVKDKEYSNWLKVTLALYYMKSGLHTFIQSEVDCLHKLLVQKIYGSKLVSPTHCTTCDASCVRRNKQSRVWTFQKRCNLCCSNWFDELSNLHTNPNSDKIFWDNSNVTLWPFSPWECAKVFMPRGQLSSNVGPDECDAQALLTLLTSCKHFHHKLSSQGLRLTSTISTIRNKVIHNGEMKLSDADRRAYIQQIIQLLEDPKSLNSLEDCKAAVGNIQKIDNDSVDVFFNVEQQMIALQEAVNAVKEDLGLQEKKTLDSVKSLKEEYRHLITKLEAVENGVGIVENGLDTVENRVDTVENRVDTVENWVDTVENRVDTVEKRVDTVENWVDTVKKRVNKVENRVDTVEKWVDTVENKVDTVENWVDTVENRVDTVEKRVDTVEKRVDTVENKQDTLENQVDTVVNRVDTFENRINTFGSNIQSVMELTTATQHQVVLSQTMSASVSRLEGRVEAVEETLVNLQDTGQWTDETICCRKDIIKLRDDLIKAYKNLRCVQVSPIFEKRRCDLENVFVDLVIVDKQGRRNTQGKSKHHTIPCKKALSSIKETNKVTSYKQLFLDERGSKFKRIYLCGKGGLGKTTFCRNVLHAWCNAHEGRAVASGDYFQDEAVLQMFDLLFYMNLREVSVDENLIDFICAQFPLEKAASKIILGNMLKLIGDKILFILDGLDEMIIKGGFIDNVVTRRKYPNCCFLVSSRPWKIFDMELHEKTEIDLLLNVIGFSKKNSMKCAKKIFENCYQDGNVIKQFHEDIARNKLAAQLIHVPLLLLFLTHVWYENKRSLPSKLHELYILFLNLMADRMKEKYRNDPNHRQTRFTIDDTLSRFPSKISETSLVVNFGEGFLLSLCQIAHHFLLSSQQENSLVFEEANLLNALGDRGKEKLNIALDLGVLSVSDSVSYLNRKTNVSFLHKTLQEFFTAACFILCPDKLANFISSIGDLNDVQQNENIIVFLVGLMPELGNHVLEKVNELCKVHWEKWRSSEGLFIQELSDINKMCLRCKEEVIGEDVLLNVSHLYLQQKDFNLDPWNPAFLQMLDLTSSPSSDYKEYVLDLRGLTGLTYLHYIT